MVGDKEMTSEMNKHIIVTESGDEIPSQEVITCDTHTLSVDARLENKYACLTFSSRIAMYDFARSLLHEALYGGSGQIEFAPLEHEGKLQVINGVRMAPESSRLIVLYPETE